MSGLFLPVRQQSLREEKWFASSHLVWDGSEAGTQIWNPAHCSCWHISRLVPWIQDNCTTSLNCEVRSGSCDEFCNVSSCQMSHADAKSISFASQCSSREGLKIWYLERTNWNVRFKILSLIRALVRVCKLPIKIRLFFFFMTWYV